jgi:hypothetical protein
VLICQVAYLLFLEGNTRFHYTSSGVECNKRFTRILQCAKRFFRLFGENLVHQVFTRLAFTKISPGFANSPEFQSVFTRFSPSCHLGDFFSSNSPPKRINFTKKMLKTLLLVNFRGAKRFLIFDFVIFQKPGEFTRFSPGFQISPSFHQKKTW